jgi:hypothetical protein
MRASHSSGSMAWIAGRVPRLPRRCSVLLRAMAHEPGSLGSGVRGQLFTSEQTRHVAPAPSPGATGELSGRTDRERVWRRQWTPDGDRWESPGLGWPSRLEADEGRSGRRCMCKGSGRRPRRLKRRHERKETRGNGRDPMRSAECSAAVRVGIRRRTPKSHPTPQGKSEETMVAMRAWRAEPAGATGLYLSRAFDGGRAA